MSGRRSYLEATARERVLGLLDRASLQECCPPTERLLSPHLALLDLPQALDDGVVTGSGLLGGRPVLIAAQEGRFNGGSVGEVHGAKLLGLVQAAQVLRPAAVLLLIDSGGVRLHEANAGILAISELARTLLALRGCGVPLLALVGGSCGAFGGMGIVTRLCDWVVMSEDARLGLSGPEVIETVMGREEFDSRDRALVWRVTGGKLRRALGEADRLVDDDIAAFRAAAIERLASLPATGLAAPTLAGLRARQDVWWARCAQFPAARDGREILAVRVGLDEDACALARADAFEAALRPHPGEPAATLSATPASPGALAPQRPPAEPLDGADLAFADRLFGPGRHRLQRQGLLLSGAADSLRGPVWLVGTRAHAAIGLALALDLAAALMAAVEHDAPAVVRRPIVLIADTQGQALSRHEELLGLNGALAHLAQCVDLARRAGHRLVTVVRGEAVSGGFLSFGMLGDCICALPGAEIRVMDLRAMARVTRIPLERLEALAASSPVFAPGAASFYQLGGLHALWDEDADWAQALAAALDAADGEDRRAQLGLERGGRGLAALVAERVCAQACART